MEGQPDTPSASDKVEELQVSMQAATTSSDEVWIGNENTIERLLARVPPDGRELVQKAYDLAARLHAGQFRKTGEPYIIHPLAVATLLADLNIDAPSVAAGLLHDVLEDTDITREELAEMFPAPIPELVQGVTKISKINFHTKREAQVENLRMMIIAMAKDIRVMIIKLCDRLHNMKTLKAMEPEKRIRISEETLDIYAPLANRLGMSQMKSEMEDLAMRWLFPDAYQHLTQQIALKRRERERLVAESIEFLRDHLLKQHPNLIITGRPKHFFSIFKKMRDQDLTFEQIHDLNAMRIICSTESQCYEILGIVHSLWRPLPGRIKDYIGNPKKNMYQSLHTTVIGLHGQVTEIQIRTEEMHRIAEHGIAAHWKYKEQQDKFRWEEKLSWLRQLTEWITDVREPEGLLEALKKDVFADRVICFTPNSDPVELPLKATPIDFAYAIHTKVGEHYVGAKINGRMVNMSTELANGDIVEIVTSSNGHPSRDWLTFAVTGRAQQKIKHWLKTQNLAEYSEKGYKSLTKLLDERHIPFTLAELDQELEKLAPAYHMPTKIDLLVEIGFGAINAQAALARMKVEWARRPEPRAKKLENPENQSGLHRGPVLIEGMDDPEIRLAGCCSPLRGDDIIAYVTRGRGITIHRLDCRNIARARHDAEEVQRLHNAQWNESGDTAQFAGIRVECLDREGLLNDITGVVRKHNIFITASQTVSDEDKGTASLFFEMKIKSAEQLGGMLQEMRTVKGVIHAERRKRSA